MWDLLTKGQWRNCGVSHNKAGAKWPSKSLRSLWSFQSMVNLNKLGYKCKRTTLLNRLSNPYTTYAPILGPIQLWQFLLEMLSDKSCHHIISWTGTGNDQDICTVTVAVWESRSPAQATFYIPNQCCRLAEKFSLKLRRLFHQNFQSVCCMSVLSLF